jgi:MinD superfamily P-loop ATPase
MKIAIASGKGGTGKTTIATNLAVVARESGRQVCLLDCDVEEPNCHIFLSPEIEHRRDLTVPIPIVDSEKCTACGECSKVCEFNAIACMGEKVVAFPELCHGCKACWMICPEKAIAPGSRVIGELEIGSARGIGFSHGRLRIGEAMPGPLIREVKKSGNSHDLTIIDAPPGTSCPMVAAINDADFVCLVTESTPFGLNDLELAVGVVKKIGLAMGVVINRFGVGDDRVTRYCIGNDIRILAEVLDDRRLAEAYSRGKMACDEIPEMRDAFLSLLSSIEGSRKK